MYRIKQKNNGYPDRFNWYLNLSGVDFVFFYVCAFETKSSTRKKQTQNKANMFDVVCMYALHKCDVAIKIYSWPKRIIFCSFNRYALVANRYFVFLTDIILF